jgi:hypothetical protein
MADIDRYLTRLSREPAVVVLEPRTDEEPDAQVREEATR